MHSTSKYIDDVVCFVFKSSWGDVVYRLTPLSVVGKVGSIFGVCQNKYKDEKDFSRAH